MFYCMKNEIMTLLVDTTIHKRRLYRDMLDKCWQLQLEKLRNRDYLKNENEFLDIVYDDNA